VGSVNDLLRSHFLTETLERTCEKCKCTTATVNKKIYTLPRILAIHLKRFKHSQTGLIVQKIHDPITINEKLNIDSTNVDPQFQGPIHFVETELSEYLKDKHVTIDTTQEDDDADLKQALNESLFTNLTEDEQVKLAIENSEKEFFNTITSPKLDMTLISMEISKSEDNADYNSDTEPIDEDDPIVKDFKELNLPTPVINEPPVLPLNEELELLDRSQYNIEDYSSNDRSYNLRAIVCHKGDSASSGHYITNILEKNQWNRYDDSIVFPINTMTATSGDTQKEAYILFYVHSSINNS